MKKIILLLFICLFLSAACTDQNDSDGEEIGCNAGGLRDSLRFLGVETKVSKDGSGCRMQLEWISPPEDSRDCLQRLNLVHPLIDYYKQSVSEPVSFTPVFCPYETEVMVKDDSAIINTGLGDGQFDHMTYATYESFVRIDPHESFSINAIQPQITGCAGLCQFNATVFSAEGQILGSAVWSWTSYGRKALEDDLSGTVNIEFDTPIMFRKGSSYLMLAVASVSSAPNVEGGSIRIHTAGIDVVIRNVANAQIFPLGPVNWDNFSPNSISDRGPMSFKLFGENLK